jgi:hypothetical protein
VISNSPPTSNNAIWRSRSGNERSFGDVVNRG